MKLNPLNWERSQQALEWWDAQALRDKVMLMFIVSVFAIGTASVTGLLMSKSLKTSRSRLQSLQSDMSKVQGLKAEYDERVGAVRKFEENIETFRSFSLAGFIERTARELDITDKVGNINDMGLSTEEYFDVQTVNVIFRKISLRVASDILYRVESAEQPIGFASADIKTDLKDRNQLNLHLSLTILRPKSNTKP